MYKPKYKHVEDQAAVSKKLGRPFQYMGLQGEAHMTIKEWKAIRDRVEGKRYLEIGSYHGYSMTAALEGGAQSISCIDKILCAIPLKFATHKYGADSRLAHKYIKDGSIDFLLIDGNHTYEYINADLRNYLPKVVEGGIIAIHDYGLEGDFLGKWEVSRAVDEHMKESEYIDTIESLILFQKGGVQA